MSTIANAKVAHNYNRYNGYFFGCLLRYVDTGFSHYLDCFWIYTFSRFYSSRMYFQVFAK